MLLTIDLSGFHANCPYCGQTKAYPEHYRQTLSERHRFEVKCKCCHKTFIVEGGRL